MSVNSPLLTIAVPTYNRRGFLEKLLQSIVSQKWFSDQVEIVINDWPSSDGTEEMVSWYLSKYRNIRYFKNPVAVGMLPAILETISMSNGKYTWIFGSDDFMSSDALETMITCIRDCGPSLALCNRFVFRNPEECLARTEHVPKILEFSGFSDFWTYIGLTEPARDADKGNYVSFMSVFCFETEYFRRSYEYVTKNVCSEKDLNAHYFHFVLVIFSRLFSSDKICLIEEPRLVFCKMDNHGWSLNKKIASDMGMLIEYLVNTYPLSKASVTRLRSFAKEWWFVCNIVGPMRKVFEKMWIYSAFSKFWRKRILKND